MRDLKKLTSVSPAVFAAWAWHFLKPKAQPVSDEIFHGKNYLLTFRSWWDWAGQGLISNTFEQFTFFKDEFTKLARFDSYCQGENLDRGERVNGFRGWDNSKRATGLLPPDNKWYHMGDIGNLLTWNWGKTFDGFAVNRNLILRKRVVFNNSLLFAPLAVALKAAQAYGWTWYHTIGAEPLDALWIARAGLSRVSGYVFGDITTKEQALCAATLNYFGFPVITPVVVDGKEVAGEPCFYKMARFGVFSYAVDVDCDHNVTGGGLTFVGGDMELSFDTTTVETGNYLPQIQSYGMLRGVNQSRPLKLKTLNDTRKKGDLPLPVYKFIKPSSDQAVFSQVDALKEVGLDLLANEGMLLWMNPVSELPMWLDFSLLGSYHCGAANGNPIASSRPFSSGSNWIYR